MTSTCCRLSASTGPSCRTCASAAVGSSIWVSSSSSAGGTPPYLASYFAAKAGMDALAVQYARELTRWGIETSIVVPGAFTSGTNHFAHSGSPADAARLAEYAAGPTAGLDEEIRTAFGRIAPSDADPATVAVAIADLVDMPFGKRPFRVHIDPTEDGAAVTFRGDGPRARRDAEPRRPLRPAPSRVAHERVLTPPMGRRTMSDNGKQNGKTAMVTGSARGIGAAVAERLGNDGFSVVVNYSSSAADAEAEVAKIKGAGARAIAVRADVSDPAAVKQLFDEATAAFGGVDVLVNNAGVMLLSTIAECDDKLFDRQVAINLKGVFNGMREAARRLRSGGRIISFSSSVVGLYQPT